MKAGTNKMFDMYLKAENLRFLILSCVSAPQVSPSINVNSFQLGSLMSTLHWDQICDLKSHCYALLWLRDLCSLGRDSIKKELSF